MAHGEVKTINGKRVASPEYRSWQMMKNRVLNPKAHDGEYYGNKGITMDARWHSFDAFLADMGRKPNPEYTLDRIDPDKGYGPENCRWATRTEQSRNRGYNRLSMVDAREIRRLYSTGQHRQQDLAAQYSVTQTTISAVIRALIWKE